MLELREIRNFVAVAERMNISAAARTVNLSQPALSRQIQSLEKRLGVSLFERAGKRLILTAEGEDLLLHATELLDRTQDLLNRANRIEKGQAGLLRVGASPQTIAWLLSPAMARFKERYPQIELIVSEGHNDALIELVAHGAVHVVIANLGIGSTLVGRRLFDARLFAILPPSHPMNGADRCSIEDLASDRMMVMSRGFLTRHLFDQVAAAHGVRPRIVLESENTHTLGALAKDGHGVAIVSSSAQDTAEIKDAVPITSQICRTSAIVSAIWNPNRYRPVALPIFVDVAARIVVEQLGGQE